MNSRMRSVIAAIVVVVVAAAAFGWYRSQHVAPVVVPTTPHPVPGVTTSPGPTADCLLPGPPPVPPDGASASAADMKLGHDVIQNFVQELENYQACRNAQLDHAGPNVPPAQKQTWLDEGNGAIDQANGLAQDFSAQIKAFHARTDHPSTAAPASAPAPAPAPH